MANPAVQCVAVTAKRTRTFANSRMPHASTTSWKSCTQGCAPQVSIEIVVYNYNRDSTLKQSHELYKIQPVFIKLMFNISWIRKAVLEEQIFFLLLKSPQLSINSNCSIYLGMFCSCSLYVHTILRSICKSGSLWLKHGALSSMIWGTQSC